MSDRPATQARLLRTEREAAAIVGCSQNTLKGHVRSGALRHVAIGNGVVKRGVGRRSAMSDSEIIFSDALAARLGVPEETVLEIARLKPVPFMISSASPRRLCIAAEHLPIWKAAIDAECCET